MIRNAPRVAALVWALASFVPRAHAEEPPTLMGKVRLGLDVTVVDHSQRTAEAERESSYQDPPSVTTRETRFGLVPMLGAVLGYHPSEELQFGVRFGVDRRTRTTESDPTDGSSSRGTEKGLDLLFLPYLEGVFVPGSFVRPFVQAGIGLLLHKTENEGVGSRLPTVAVGASVGLRRLVTSGFGMDYAIAMRYLTGTEKVEVESSPSQRLSTSGYQILFTVGLGGWIPTARTPPPAKKSEADLAPIARPAPAPPPTLLIPPALAPPSSAPAEPSIAPAAPSSAPIEEKEIPLEDVSIRLRSVAGRVSDPVWVGITKLGRQGILGSCTTLEIVIEGETLLIARAQHEARDFGGSVMETLSASIGRVDLEAVTVGEDVWFVACDRRWPLDATRRRALHDFLHP